MIEGEFLRVDGVRLYVAQHGGGGKPLLLINGVGAHHAMWSVALEHLGDLSIIMADPPGIGRSPAVPFPLTISDYAGLVAAVVRKLGHEQVDVLGYSFGGAVAQELTRRHSALVRRLVLVGTSCGGGGIPGTAPALATLFTPLRYHSPGFYNATVGWISADGTERDPAIIDHASSLRSLHRPTLMGYAAQLNALMHWSSLRWLHTLRPPTLVVSGDADPLVPPANGALLASMIPEARLRIQPGEGHFLTLDPSSTMWEGVGDFLRSNQHPESSSWQTAIEVTRTMSGPSSARPGVRPSHSPRFMRSFARSYLLWDLSHRHVPRHDAFVAARRSWARHAKPNCGGGSRPAVACRRCVRCRSPS